MSNGCTSTICVDLNHVASASAAKAKLRHDSFDDTTWLKAIPESPFGPARVEQITGDRIGVTVLRPPRHV
jgi:hypothetical protein